MIRVTVVQIVEDCQLQQEDLHENPCGEYNYDLSSEDALEEFHVTVPISCLEHFDITTEEI